MAVRTTQDLNFQDFIMEILIIFVVAATFFYACVVARMVRLMDSKPMQRLGNSHQRPYLPYSKNRGELSHKHYLWGFRHQVSIVSATWRIEILS